MYDNLKLINIYYLAIELWSRPSTVSTIITPGTQIKQELVIDFKDIPYGILNAGISFKYLVKFFLN